MTVPEKALINDLKTFMVYKCLIDIKKGELRDMFERITVFDVETPNRQNNRICSIGIKINNFRIVRTLLLQNRATDFLWRTFDFLQTRQCCQRKVFRV